MTLDYSQSNNKKPFPLFVLLVHLIVVVVLAVPVVTFSFQPRRQEQQSRRIRWNDVVKSNTASSSSHQQLRRPLMALWMDETDGRSRIKNLKTTNFCCHQRHHVAIEYCTKSRWMLKSFWFTQELLSTFGKSELLLDAVTVLPCLDTTGIFVIRLSEIINNHHNNLLEEDEVVASVAVTDQILWDRQQQKGFPALKDLKQMVRDAINPDKYLGHSDTEARRLQQSQDQQHSNDNDNNNKVAHPSSSNGSTSASSPPVETTVATTTISVMTPCMMNTDYMPTPAVTIHYCTGCQWLLRAAYLGQELLTAFSEGEDELIVKSVTLVPSHPPEKGGLFSIELDGKVLFDRKTEGRFPEPEEIKQMIRDQIAPDKDLGHSDVIGNRRNNGMITSSNNSSDDDAVDIEDGMDDQEAEEARKYFGVM